MKFYILYFIFIVILFCYWFQFYKKREEEKECYETDSSFIYFLNKNETKDLLLQDNDKYYSKFYRKDFQARNAKGVDDYLSKISNSPSDFTNEEKIHLTKMINQIKNKVVNIHLPWFSPEKFNSLKWKIALTNGSNYENGLPHTRNDIIFISRQYMKYHKFISTLLHEQIHIYQKQFPDDMEIYLKLNNFGKKRRREENDGTRGNSDIDEWIYTDKEGEEIKAMYNENPKNLLDVRYNTCDSQKCEHPFERMAIEISKMI